MASERKEFMRHVQERLAVLQMRQDVETEHIVVGEFKIDQSHPQEKRLRPLDVEGKLKHLEVHNRLRHVDNDDRSGFIEGERSGYKGGNRSMNDGERSRQYEQHHSRSRNMELDLSGPEITSMEHKFQNIQIGGKAGHGRHTVQQFHTEDGGRVQIHEKH